MRAVTLEDVIPVPSPVKGNPKRKKCLAEAGVAEVDAGGLGEAAKATAP